MAAARDKAGFVEQDGCARVCPLLAQSGHRLVHCTCPLLGAKRTSAVAATPLGKKDSKPGRDIWATGASIDGALHRISTRAVQGPVALIKRTTDQFRVAARHFQFGQRALLSVRTARPTNRDAFQRVAQFCPLLRCRHRSGRTIPLCLESSGAEGRLFPALRGSVA
jgi:hypothetical protein